MVSNRPAFDEFPGTVSGCFAFGGQTGNKYLSCVHSHWKTTTDYGFWGKTHSYCPTYILVIRWEVDFCCRRRRRC
jgi:hypothetical protein